ncbi:aquaporin [Nocardia sp. NPDC047038]|uniref:MIP/aquaporin family protein n=1 Tax=Nocardia sp. NPDC047038 TaxID=3154338 RepID=UPI0033D4C4F1
MSSLLEVVGMVSARPEAERPVEFADPGYTDMLRKLTAEAIGTGFIVFTAGATAHSGTTLTPLATGAVLMAMVYAGAPVSGAHYNPAVTLAALIRGRIRTGAACGYWLTQVMAALVAALMVRVVIDSPPLRAPNPSGYPLDDAVAVEWLFTFALAYVVLSVSTTAGTPANSFYGLAIGAIAAVGGIAVGGVSGAAFNPAIVLGGTVVGLFAPVALPYVLAELLGGAIAGVAFRLLNPAAE